MRTSVKYLLGSRMAPRTAVRTTLLIASAFILPVAILSLYMAVSSWIPGPSSEGTEDVALVVSLVIGVTFIWYLPTRWEWRLALSFVQLGAMKLVLPVWGLVFSCVVLGTCL